MSPIQESDVLAISRNDPQTAGTYKVMLSEMRDFFGTPQGAVKPDWNADPATPAGILNRPSAATGTTQGLMSGADKAKLDGINPANYVAKAGDTMTGPLEIRHQPYAWLTTVGGLNATGLLVKEFGSEANTVRVTLQVGDGSGRVDATKGLKLASGSNHSVEIAPQGGSPFIFDASNFYTERPISVLAHTDDNNLRLMAGGGGHAKVRFLSRDWAQQWAQIDARYDRTDYAGRREVWLRAAQEDANGFVQLHGGSGAGTPFILSAGSESNRIADVDGGGNWHPVSDRKAKTAIRGIALGLEAVLKMRPVSFRYRAEADAKGGNAPERLGFVAQEMEEVVPEAVKVNEDGLYTLAPTLLIPVLVKAIQELTARVQQLEGAA